jgi:Chemoreceptor zinc-binding domain
MSSLSEIDRAISKHAMWKMHLRTAIDTGKSESTPDRVGSDNLCDFGTWLHALPDEERNSAEWIKVQTLHAEFHGLAAKVLKMALDGNREEANAALASGFKTASAKLTNAMVDWKNKQA